MTTIRRAGPLVALCLWVASTELTHAQERGQTILEASAAGGVARTAHERGENFLGFGGDPTYAQADYALVGGSFALSHRKADGPLTIVGRFSHGLGLLTEADDLYRNFGTAVARYRMSSVTAGLRFSPRYFDLGVTFSVAFAKDLEDRESSRARFGWPRADFRIHVAEDLDLLLAFGSTDGFIWDASLGTVGLSYRRARLRAEGKLGVGARLTPALTAHPRGSSFDWGFNGSGDPGGWFLAIAELHVAFHERLELGGRFQILGTRPQGSIVFTYAGPPSREHGSRRARSDAEASAPRQTDEPRSADEEPG